METNKIPTAEEIKKFGTKVSDSIKELTAITERLKQKTVMKWSKPVVINGQPAQMSMTQDGTLIIACRNCEEAESIVKKILK